MSLALGTNALKALKEKYRGDKAYAEANLAIYLTNMVAIGEHSDLLAEIDIMITKIADLDGKLDVLLLVQTEHQMGIERGKLEQAG